MISVLSVFQMDSESSLQVQLQGVARVSGRPQLRMGKASQIHLAKLTVQPNPRHEPIFFGVRKPPSHTKPPAFGLPPLQGPGGQFSPASPGDASAGRRAAPQVRRLGCELAQRWLKASKMAASTIFLPNRSPKETRNEITGVQRNPKGSKSSQAAGSEISWTMLFLSQ